MVQGAGFVEAQEVHMTPKQLEKIIRWDDFKPYKLVLADGEEIIVDRPRKSHVSGGGIALVGNVKRKGSQSVIKDKFRLIYCRDVVSAEHVDVPIRRTY
jgi:hypothetical protein